VGTAECSVVPPMARSQPDADDRHVSVTAHLVVQHSCPRPVRVHCSARIVTCGSTPCGMGESRTVRPASTVGGGSTSRLAIPISHRRCRAVVHAAVAVGSTIAARRQTLRIVSWDTRYSRARTAALIPTVLASTSSSISLCVNLLAGCSGRRTRNGVRRPFLSLSAALVFASPAYKWTWHRGTSHK